MAYLEISTNELAKIITSYLDSNISNVKGLTNGFSFEVELGIRLLPKSIPLKLVFTEFDEENEIIIFEILPNSNSKILKKGFVKILKAISNLIPEDELPEGVWIEQNFLFINPAEMIETPGIEVTV